MCCVRLHAFGWRIPFAIGALGALVVLWLRLSMEESDQFNSTNKKNKQAGTLRLLAKYPKQVLIVVGMTLGGTISFYTYTTYLQQFMINTTGLSKESAAMINFLALLVAARYLDADGFGSFSLHYRPPRMGRNPKTGESVALPGKHVPHFKPGKELRERVSGGRTIRFLRVYGPS